MESYRIGNLPEELVHEILLRLPVKALLVCKCVCTDWCALIESPGFVNRHFSHESNQESLVFYGLLRIANVDNDDKEEKDVDPYVMYDEERHSLVEAPNHLRQIPAFYITEWPENGIFCLKSWFLLSLFNPATREFTRLPPMPSIHTYAGRARPWIGCALDPSSGDFKVVAFRQNEICNYAFVYNLSTNLWKTVETIDPYDKIGYSDCNGIPTLNGVKHWLAKCTNSNIYSLLAFDMRSEKFKKIAIPDALGNTDRTLQITTYCDMVAVLSYKCNECANLWVMERDGSWSKNFSIGPCSKNVRPLHVWKKNKVFFSASSHMIICDVSTQKVTTHQLKDPNFCAWRCFRYKESLVSIEGVRVDCLKDALRLYRC